MCQTTLIEFYAFVRFCFIPMRGSPENRHGLSERTIRRMLEREGWTVWRGGSIGAHRLPDAWPAVQRKYGLLAELLGEQHDLLALLAHVHHGMPDFLCYRRGEWKFVECKLGHEQLSARQKICIERLQALGYVVEVHKLVEDCTKTRLASVDVRNGTKRVHDRQTRLKLHWRAQTMAG